MDAHPLAHPAEVRALQVEVELLRAQLEDRDARVAELRSDHAQALQDLRADRDRELTALRADLDAWRRTAERLAEARRPWWARWFGGGD